MIKRYFIVLFTISFALGGVAVAQTDVERLHHHFIQRLVYGSEKGELQGKPIKKFMQEEKISILEGDFKLLGALNSDTSAIMEMTIVDGKRYAISFIKDSVRKAVISYPASYQLILGTTLMEAENLLLNNVRRTALPPVEDGSISGDILQRIGTSDIYILKGFHYTLPELNANRYYVKESDTVYSLLYSEDLPMETMANLVTGTEIENQLMLNITMVKYGYKIDSATVPLRQWITYCFSEGCVPYFGVMTKESEKMVCELLMINEMLGYAHVMKMEFNPKILANREGKIKARLNSYIPIWNLKSLMDDKN